MTPRTARLLATAVAIALPLAGFAVGVAFEKQRSDAPVGPPGLGMLFGPPPETAKMRTHTVEQMTHALALDDAQRARIDDILRVAFDDAFPQAEEARRRAVMEKARADLMEVLTPAQRARVDDMRKRGPPRPRHGRPTQGASPPHGPPPHGGPPPPDGPPPDGN